MWEELLVEYTVFSTMAEEKLVCRVLLRQYWKKRLNAAAAAKEICAVEGEGTVHPSTARKWFQRFRSGDTSLDDKPKSGLPVTTDIDALLNAVEGNPGASTRQLATEVSHHKPVSFGICINLVFAPGNRAWFPMI